MKSTYLPSIDKAPRLRVGLRDVSSADFAEAVQKKIGKQRVSIMLDSAIVDYFKTKAGARGYQTLINSALNQSMINDHIESTIRRVIREELRSA